MAAAAARRVGAGLRGARRRVRGVVSVRASAAAGGGVPRARVVGLGPGDARLLTQEAFAALNSAEEVWCRTANHPTLNELPETVSVRTFDSLYEADEADDFEVVYSAIADEVLRLAAEKGDVLYAVPGDPTVAERSVKLLVERAARAGVRVDVLSSVSFLEPTLAALGLDVMPRLVLGDACELATMAHPPFEPDSPLLLSQVYNGRVASDAKLTLMNAYPDDHECALVHSAGTRQCSVEWLPLYELDRSRKIDVMTVLYVPPLPPPQDGDRATYSSMRGAVAALRDNLDGPWAAADEVEHTQLASGLVRAAEATRKAAAAGDESALAESLAAVLAHAAAHLQVAEDEGHFTSGDVFATATALASELLPSEGGGASLGRDSLAAGPLEDDLIADDDGEYESDDAEGEGSFDSVDEAEAEADLEDEAQACQS